MKTVQSQGKLTSILTAPTPLLVIPKRILYYGTRQPQVERAIAMLTADNFEMT
ncbi:MAG: hypothetical protein ACTXOO_04885 [Sodalis sp. (in: enterobacteria)]